MTVLQRHINHVTLQIYVMRRNVIILVRERKLLASRGNEAATQIGKTTDRYVRAIASPDARGVRARLRSCVLTCIRGQQCGKDGCTTTPPVMRLMRPPLCRTVSPSAYGDRERFWDARYRDRRGTPAVNNKLRSADHLTSTVSLRSSRTASPVSQLLCFIYDSFEL